MRKEWTNISLGKEYDISWQLPDGGTRQSLSLN